MVPLSKSLSAGSGKRAISPLSLSVQRLGHRESCLESVLEESGRVELCHGCLCAAWIHGNGPGRPQGPKLDLLIFYETAWDAVTTGN